jgi:integrase
MTGEIITKERRKNVAEIYVDGMQTKRTRAAQWSALEVVAREFGGGLSAREFPWESLRYEHMIKIQNWLTDNYKPGSAKRYMAAVRGTLRAAWRSKIIDSETYHRAVDLPVIHGSTTTGRMLTMDEIEALLNTCRKGPPTRGIRDAAAICVMFGCGLRLNEVTGLDFENLDREKGKIKLTGKWQKERYAYIRGAVKVALDAWLELRGTEPGPLFWSVSKSDEFHGKRMSGVSLYMMIKERGETAGLKAFTPHDLRRSFISHMLYKTDAATVARLAGHENIATTLRYDRRPEEQLAEAAGLLEVPFTKRDEL